MDEFCNSLDAFSFEHLDRKNIASMCFAAGAGPGGDGGGEPPGHPGLSDVSAANTQGMASPVGHGYSVDAPSSSPSNVGPPSWAPAFFNTNPKNNAPMRGPGFTGPAAETEGYNVEGFLSGLFDLATPISNDITDNVVGFNNAKGTLAEAMEAANQDTEASISITGSPTAADVSNEGDSGGGSDYTGVIYPPQAGPSVLNPTAAPIPQPQYQFRRNWWEGNDFIPAPITRIV